MRAGWDRCGYGSIPDPEMEGEMDMGPGERLQRQLSLPDDVISTDDDHGERAHDWRRYLVPRREMHGMSGEDVSLNMPAAPAGQGWRSRFLSEDNGRRRSGSWGGRGFFAGSLWRAPVWRRQRNVSNSEGGRGQGSSPWRRKTSVTERRSGTMSDRQDRQEGSRRSETELLQVEFDPDYDTSRDHLVKLFKTLDQNGSGTISYETMRMGLANLGTYTDLNYLMRQADLDKSKEISLDDFVETVQDLAAKMFAAKREVSVSCFCYDYSSAEVSYRRVKTGEQTPPSPFVPLRELLAEDSTGKGRVRWICLSGSDPSLVIRLANRYGIHPLQVEDCLNPRERLKVDAFQASRIRVVPRGSCSSCGTSSQSNQNKNKSSNSDDAGILVKNEPFTPAWGGPGPEGQEGAEIAAGFTSSGERHSDPTSNGLSHRGGLFSGGFGHDLETSVGHDNTGATHQGSGDHAHDSAEYAGTSSKNNKDGILHLLLARIFLCPPSHGRPSNFAREQISIFLIGDHTVLFIERSQSNISDQISNRILYAGSKLRLNNAKYLVYSLVDSIVDNVFPIMQHYRGWLVQLQGMLHSSEAGPSLEVVRAIQQISRDMHMLMFYLRPMKMVAAQLIIDLPGDDLDLKRHLEDLRDHVLVLEEQALRMSTWGRSLNKDWVNEQQHRMNQVVYILTMVTSAFMPAQFLTGVFGMNFKFMPELNWRYSYASFWVLVAILAFTSYTVYKRQRWL